MKTARIAPVDGSILLSVGVVTYNRAALLDGCLRTVYRAVEGIPHEIVVVDNASTDATADLVRERHPDVTLLVNLRNAGLARGINQIIARARGRHLLLLDDDTEVDAPAIARLLEFQQTHPRVGAVGPRLVYPDGSEQAAAKAFPTPLAALFGRRSLLRRLAPNNAVSRRYLISAYASSVDPYEVDSVSAACILLDRKVVERVGGMDEDFFVYWSDVEWCRRIKDDGWKIYVVPGARVVHFEGRKITKQRPAAIIDFHRGAYRYYHKHHARFPLHPMRLVALVGLSTRATLLLGVNVLRPAAGGVQGLAGAPGDRARGA
jgi:GT2 family glycosyltransferase